VVVSEDDPSGRSDAMRLKERYSRKPSISRIGLGTARTDFIAASLSAAALRTS